MDVRETLIRELLADRALAHQTLFRHRHPNKTPAFHLDVIRLIYSEHPRVLILAFRGSAKSTIAEEATIVEALFREFKNKVILGATQTRAIDRLTAIKHELMHNEDITNLFGNMVGPVWNEDKIVLSNGVCIQAFGPGQSFRGVKHLDHRPDRLDIDDLEDEENIKDDNARASLRGWLRRVVFPACDPGARVRMYATPLDPDALPMHFVRSSAWTTATFPIFSIDELGVQRPLWPDRYPLVWIEEKRREFELDGALHEFAQEYLCVAEDTGSKIFTEGMLVTRARVRTWEPVYAAYDPARSKGRRAATTGVAVFSWIGRKLVVWRAAAEHWLPDEIVKDVLAVDAEYSPVSIGVETTGLVEFVEQPLRHAALDRQSPLPIQKLSPPRGGGQTKFIEALQPFFRAGEVEFACDITAEVRSQFLGFPTGRRDFLNALAYALLMRPGQPVYEGFSHENVVAELAPLRDLQTYLVVNATAQFTCGALCQIGRAGLRLLSDWVREGPPGDNLGDIVRAASLVSGARVTLVAPPAHFMDYDTIGLRAAAGQVPVSVSQGGAATAGREELRTLMASQWRGVSRLQVAQTARWTLNALSGGYARSVLKSGHLSVAPVSGAYAILMEGLESFLAAGRLDIAAEEQPRYAVAEDGRRFVTANPHVRSEPRPDKDQWWRS